MIDPITVLKGFAAIGLVIILLLAYVSSKKSSAVGTPSGGVTMAGSPSADTPIPETGAPASISSAAPVLPPSKLVKKIKIVKDTSNSPNIQGTDQDWRTFQVAEVYAFAGEKKLTANDFSDATLSTSGGYSTAHGAKNVIDGNAKTFSHTDPANVGMLTLTLKDATTLTAIHVLNRQDCCWGRLAGATILLEDETGNVLWNGVLTNSKDIQIFSVSV